MVSFVFRSLPPGRLRGDITLLEVGFGTGANLWFAAREGLRVSGVEGSARAVAAARERLAAEGLAGDLRQGRFDELPFSDATFDIVVDRAALACAERAEMERALREIARVSKDGAKFLFTPYATEHTSATSGVPGAGGQRREIVAGSLAGLPQITFLDLTDVESLLHAEWVLESVRRVESVELLGGAGDVDAELRVIARRCR